MTRTTELDGSDTEHVELLQRVRDAAQLDIDEENFEALVEECKVKLRARRWWHALIPFKIVIVRRTA